MGRIGYCSACDRNVPVILSSAADFSRTPAPDDAEALVCLDYGVRCTGALCPLFSVDAGAASPGEGVAREGDRPGPSRGEGPDLSRPAQA
jgi:hypothetical protein